MRIRRPDQRSSAKREGPLEKYQQFTPLIDTAEQILDDLHDDLDLKWSGKLGHLRQFVKNQKPPRKDERPKNNQNKDQIQNTPIGEIVVIHGEPGVGGDSNRSRKAHLRKLCQMKPDEVNLVERPSKLAKLGRPPIVFSEKDEEGISYPHDDPLLGIDEQRLRQVKSNLHGFSGKPIPPKGRIALPITIGPEGNSITCMVDFLVVNSLAAYNLIIERPLLNQIGAVVSTYHLKMKFPVGEAIAEVKGGKTVDMRDEEKLIHREPAEELVEAEQEPGAYRGLPSIQHFTSPKEREHGSRPAHEVGYNIVKPINEVPGGVMMQYLDAPSIVKPVNEVQIVEYKRTWAGPIVCNIKDGEVPDDTSQARKLRIKAARYALMGDVLYRRSFTLPYLRCLIPT
ncbi:hypothetical protein Vadar_026630 [Vaccinium darrowii]|uniref:Uncharacterized protein n=1 Tax=Vaccinium darrowii TaxID=229202 RepID=A0ACB7ZEJ4_9ERIC|nr:hypothetical protein Vadar_026630 [Vaccinium darrowii]